jgi:hypothetical protein
VKIAILDDYQNVALSIADWSAVAKKADITVFNDHIEHTDALIERLLRSTLFASCASARLCAATSSNVCRG